MYSSTLSLFASSSFFWSSNGAEEPRYFLLPIGETSGEAYAALALLCFTTARITIARNITTIATIKNMKVPFTPLFAGMEVILVVTGMAPAKMKLPSVELKETLNWEPPGKFVFSQVMVLPMIVVGGGLNVYSDGLIGESRLISITSITALSYQPGVKLIPQLSVDSVNNPRSLIVNNMVKLWLA